MTSANGQIFLSSQIRMIKPRRPCVKTLSCAQCIVWDVKEPTHFVQKSRAWSSQCCGLFSVIYHGLGGQMLGDISHNKLL